MKNDSEPPSLPPSMSAELSLDELRSLRERLLSDADLDDDDDVLMVLIGMAETMHHERSERFRIEELSTNRERIWKELIEELAKSINECQHDGGCRAFKHLK